MNQISEHGDGHRWQALTSEQEPASPEERRRWQLECYELILDNIYNGVMITDARGKIIYMNKPYGDFLGLDPKQQVGRHCLDVVENTRMHQVARTGKPEINMTQEIKGQNMVVQRIPIRKQGQVVAVFGQVMFKDVKDVTKLANRLSLLESKVKLYEQELMTLRSTKYTLESIEGTSPVIRSLKDEAAHASGNDFPVLITGESGTGKEVFAQAIHHAGPRRVYPFVRINCSAIPKDLMESELFGYAKGAFTGALSQGKPGKFELADNGTVFLDEIGELPLEMQPKLLRVLEDKEFERVGGTRIIHSDFRLIAATNQDLEAMMAQGRFRKDLFYRLNVIPLHIPPLRERSEDTLPLARHILSQLAREAGAGKVSLSPEAESLLRSYHWPGNVRELTNVLERTLSSLENDVLEPDDFPRYFTGQKQPQCDRDQGTLQEVVNRAERQAIIRALERSGQNKAKAAQMLGIHRTLLYKKMHKLGLAG